VKVNTKWKVVSLTDIFFIFFPITSASIKSQSVQGNYGKYLFKANHFTVTNRSLTIIEASKCSCYVFFATLFSLFLSLRIGNC